MAKENHGYKLRIIAIICYVAAFVGVALRFYVRKFVVGKLALDDWLMAVAMVSVAQHLINSNLAAVCIIQNHVN